MNKDIIYGLTVLVIDVGKGSHIKELINNVSRCLDCEATDYDIIVELSGAKQSMLHRNDVIMTSLWSKVDCLSMIIDLDSSLISHIYIMSCNDILN